MHNFNVKHTHSKWPDSASYRKDLFFSAGRPLLLFHILLTSGILLFLLTVWSVIQIVEFGLRTDSFTQTSGFWEVSWTGFVFWSALASFPFLVLPWKITTPKITHIIFELWKHRIRKISLCKTDITLCQSYIVLNLSVCFPKVTILVFSENILHPF